MEVSLATLHSIGCSAVLQECFKAPLRVLSKCNQPRPRHPDSDGNLVPVIKSHETMYNHSSERSVYGTECCTCTGSKFSFSHMKALQKHCMLKTQQLNTHNFLLFTKFSPRKVDPMNCDLRMFHLVTLLDVCIPYIPSSRRKKTVSGLHLW